MFFKKNKKPAEPQHMVIEVREIKPKDETLKLFSDAITHLEPIYPDTLPEIVTIPYSEYLSLLEDRAVVKTIKGILKNENIASYEVDKYIKVFFDALDLKEPEEPAEDPKTEDNVDA